MIQNARKVQASAQQGLGLVEVLVAMAIGLILLLGLSALFVKSTTTFKANDDFSRMQENGTYALNTIGNDLRLAGFYGYITSTDISLPNPITITDDCAVGWATTFAEPLSGLHNPTTAAATAALSCINAANFITNTPILVIRGATGIRVLPAKMEAGSLYVQADPTGGIVFKGNAYSTFSASTKRWVLNALKVPEEAPIYIYHAKAYYLRPCSRPTGTGGTVCLAADDAGRPVPTLVRQELVGTRMVETSVAEGVEAWRVLFGLDTVGSDGVPDTVVENPTAAQFLLAVTARVSVLVRSAKASNGYDDSGKRYDLDGDGVFDFACTPGVDCDFHRHVFTQSFQIRNISQRRESNP